MRKHAHASCRSPAFGRQILAPTRAGAEGPPRTAPHHSEAPDTDDNERNWTAGRRRGLCPAVKWLRG